MVQYLSREAAGAARRESIVQRTDRPSQRRGQMDVDARAAMSAKASMELRDAEAGRSTFHGLASAYERGYVMFDVFGEYTEVVSAGAGARSLARADLDVPLVLDHTSLRRIARTSTGTLSLRETERGLDVEAPDLDMDDLDVAYIAPKIRAGLIDEMSFMFRIVRGSWSPDYTEFRIEEYDIHRGDVAIVGYGANPYTAAELRTAPAVRSGRDLISASDVRLMRL